MVEDIKDLAGEVDAEGELDAEAMETEAINGTKQPVSQAKAKAKDTAGGPKRKADGDAPETHTNKRAKQGPRTKVAPVPTNVAAVSTSAVSKSKAKRTTKNAKTSATEPGTKTVAVKTAPIPSPLIVNEGASSANAGMRQVLDCVLVPTAKSLGLSTRNAFHPGSVAISEGPLAGLLTRMSSLEGLMHGSSVESTQVKNEVASLHRFLDEQYRIMFHTHQAERAVFRNAIDAIKVITASRDFDALNLLLAALEAVFAPPTGSSGAV